MIHEEVFTIQEIATALKLSPQFISRELLRGRLVGFRLGSNWRVLASDLAAYIEARRAQTARYVTARSR